MRISSICILLVFLFSAHSLYAEEIKCEKPYGNCTISETGYQCECGNGMGVAAGGGVAVAGVGTATDTAGAGGDNAIEVTKENCDKMLENNCGRYEVLDSCDSDKGACVIYREGNSCVCADGSHNGSDSGSSGGGSSPGEPPSTSVNPTTDPDDVKTEPARRLMADPKNCGDLLTTECPNDAPDAKSECGDDAYDIATKVIGWLGDCSGETMKVWAYEYVEFCKMYKENTDEFKTAWECMQKSGCDKFMSDCFETYEAQDTSIGAPGSNSGSEKSDSPSGLGAFVSSISDDETGGVNSKNTEEADGSDDEGGCNQSGSFSGFLMLLGLFACLYIRQTKVKSA